jgi:hypothetical protein
MSTTEVKTDHQIQGVAFCAAGITDVQKELVVVP